MFYAFLGTIERRCYPHVKTPKGKVKEAFKRLFRPRTDSHDVQGKVIKKLRTNFLFCMTIGMSSLY